MWIFVSGVAVGLIAGFFLGMRAFIWRLDDHLTKAERKALRRAMDRECFFDDPETREAAILDGCPCPKCRRSRPRRVIKVKNSPGTSPGPL